MLDSEELFIVENVKQDAGKLSYVKRPLKFAEGVNPTKSVVEEATLCRSLLGLMQTYGKFSGVQEIAGEPVLICGRKKRNCRRS